MPQRFGPSNASLALLNATGLARDNPRLYQFLSNLIGDIGGVSSEVARNAGGGGGGGGGGTGNVTTSGGTPATIAMFTTAINIQDVSAAGISSALDLLP